MPVTMKEVNALVTRIESFSNGRAVSVGPDLTWEEFDQLAGMARRCVDVLDTTEARRVLDKRDWIERRVTTGTLQISDMMLVGEARQMVDHQLRKLRTAFLGEVFMEKGA